MVDKEKNNVHNSSEVLSLKKQIQVIIEKKDKLIKILRCNYTNEILNGNQKE